MTVMQYCMPMKNCSLIKSDVAQLLALSLAGPLPETLPHVDDSSDDDVARACLVPPDFERAASPSLPLTDALAQDASTQQAEHDVAISPRTPAISTTADGRLPKRRRLRFKQALPEAFLVSVLQGNVLPSLPVPSVGTYGVSG